jgi:putative phosphoesterase
MRVGLLADTHDRIPAIADLVKRMVDGGASLIMHAGDYCSPFSLEPFQEANIPLLGVFGRNDGDHEGLSAYASSLGVGAELYESPHSFEVGGHQILLVHDIGEVNSRSIEQHKFVIHGSTHQVEMKTRGDTLLVNPGEACGWMYGSCTGAILDFKTKEVEIIKL